jgi:hypothetical protein
MPTPDSGTAEVDMGRNMQYLGWWNYRCTQENTDKLHAIKQLSDQASSHG